MKTERRNFWTKLVLASLFMVTLIGGCKKDDFEEISSVCPEVISTNPTSEAINVTLIKVIDVTFNEKMDPATITAGAFELTGPVTKSHQEAASTIKVLAGSLTYNEATKTMSFTPTVNLEPNTLYTGTVKTSVKDLLGNRLQTDYMWSFTTGVPPTVISTFPQADAAGVPINARLTAIFSTGMDSLTFTPTTFTLNKGNQAVSGTVICSDNKATFRPSAALTANTLYTATITNGVKSREGIAMVNQYVWSFTTGSGPDVTLPTVISTVPTNLATDVKLNINPTATFSKDMDPLTITPATFTITQGNNVAVSGVVIYVGTVATFVPSVDFNANKVYTATITTGVEDVAGNAMASDYVWTFTTGTGTDDDAPTVIITNPADLATDVSVSVRPSATFSEPLDPMTITPNSFSVRLGNQLISGTVTYTGVVATFRPSVSLNASTEYTATITTAVQDLAGNNMLSNYEWTFTTGNETDIVPPTVVSSVPADLATGVALNIKPIATFSEVMDPLTINASSYTLKRGTTTVPGVVSYSGLVATYSPVTDLLANTMYTATITTAVKDLAGNNMSSNYVWTFTTGNGTDIVPPTVVSTVPSDQATEVVLNIKPTVTFSEVMDPLTINASSYTLKRGTTTVPGVVSYNGLVATYSPVTDLLANTMYTATITTAAKDLAGNNMSSNYVWTFTTGTGTDIVPPTVVSTVPIDLATGVAVNAEPIVTFSEVMDPTTINASSYTLKRGTTTVPGVVSYSGLVATYSPTTDLLANTMYTATITTAVKDQAGNNMLSSYVWTFTTLNVPAPTVISTDPMDMDIDVALDKVISADFSEEMNASTINESTFTLKRGTTTVSGLVDYSGTTATFAPSSDLLSNTTYTATITTGAENLSGIPLVSSYEWTFTTLNVPAPAVISTDPMDMDIGVALDKVISADFSEEMNASTINESTFTLKRGTTTVSGLVDYSGTTATFAPSSDLLSNTTYTATITTGAENLSGTPLASDYVWTFTTEEVIVPIIDLGTAAVFGAFGGNAGITNQGINTVVNGSIATTAASTLVTGFHDGMTGDVYTETPLNVGLVTDGIFAAPPFPGTTTNEAIATQALVDANAAYVSISPGIMSGGIDPGAGELGGLTLAPGVYLAAGGTFNISNGPLTLDAQGDPNATWVFQTAAGLTVGIAGPDGARSVVMINGAQPKNVFWYVGSSATINGAGGGTMVGTIIATAGVTFSTPDNMVQTVLNGRAISLVASVTMVNTTINIPEE